jgi:hypothetical protein
VIVSPTFALSTDLIAAESTPTSPTPSSATSVSSGDCTASVSISPSKPVASRRMRSPRRMLAVDDAEVDERPAVGVVDGVEHERSRRRVRVAARRRDPVDDRIEHRVDVPTVLRADPDDAGRLDAEDRSDLLGDLLRAGRGEIDLVEDRDDLEVGVEREVEVRERLRLESLGRIDEQDRPLAGSDRTRDLVGEVDVPGRVDQVEQVLVADVPERPVGHPDRLRLDRDPALALDVHLVEVLGPHVAASTRPVTWSMRSASVDFPWSTWATMQKFRMRSCGYVTVGRSFESCAAQQGGPEGRRAEGRLRPTTTLLRPDGRTGGARPPGQVPFLFSTPGRGVASPKTGNPPTVVVT